MPSPRQRWWRVGRALAVNRTGSFRICGRSRALTVSELRITVPPRTRPRTPHGLAVPETTERPAVRLPPNGLF